MKVNLFKKVIFSVIMLFLLVVFNNCNEDESGVPYVPVNLSLKLEVYNQLMTPGYSMVFDSVGYGGIIVFCEMYDLVTPSNSIYYAFDATCTNELSEDCSLEVTGNSVYAVCPCCGSEFSFYGGYPYKGDASHSLKQYNISIFNNSLYISN